MPFIESPQLETPNQRFAALEGIRALCALAIVVFHARTFTGPPWGTGGGEGDAGPWLAHLNVGVSVFFVLSGFLLFRPFVQAHLTDQGPPGFRAYLARRMIRIYPAYWLALILSTMILGLDLGNWWATVRIYTLTHIYWGDTALGGLVQSWSLATEVSFYLFLPLWAHLVRRIGAQRANRIEIHTASLIVLYLSGVGVRWWLRDGGHSIGYATLAANTDLFALGMGLALIEVVSRTRGFTPRPVQWLFSERPLVAAVLGFACYWALVAIGYPEGFNEPTVFQELARQILFGIIGMAVVGAGVFGLTSQTNTGRLLRSWPLWALGTISYGIYLWHLTLLEKLAPIEWLVGSPSLLALVSWAALGSIIAASASWVALERPLIGWLRQRSARGGSSSIHKRE